MLGIVCAMASEARPVLDLMTDVKNETFAKKQFYVGNLLGKKAVLCVSDIGKVNSSLGATLCILKYGATVILNFGVVGAIDPSLKIGDVVVGTSAMQYDFDLSLPNGIDRGQLSNFGDKHIPLTQKYVDEFAKLGFKTGRLATTDAFKFNYDNWCYCRECDLLVEDMEIGAIAQVCSLMGVDVVSIKSVSNMVDENGANEFNEMEINAIDCYAKIIPQVIEVIYGKN